MTSLARIQGDMQAFLLRGDRDVQSQVVGTQRVPIETRLGIYRHAYGARLVEALGANYPAMAKLLGDAQFEELAYAYVASHDSHSFSVRQYGHEFFQGMPTDFLQELARWEWTIADVFDAADATPVPAASLSSIAPEEWSELRFGFHPSTKRLTLATNAPLVWKALTDDQESPGPAGLEATTWLLWRHELRTFYRSLGKDEAQMLDGATHGTRFGDLCTNLCVHCTEDEAPARAAGFLRQWIESGMIVEASY
jgi:hypothetical protein